MTMALFYAAFAEVDPKGLGFEFQSLGGKRTKLGRGAGKFFKE
jgi:hypothetical protein